METTVSIWPATIILSFFAIGFACNIFKAGQENSAEGYTEFFFEALIFKPIVIAILWWGNFFAPLGWGV